MPHESSNDLLRAQHGIIGEDQWHNRLHLGALENGIIGHFSSIMWKSLLGRGILLLAFVSLSRELVRQRQTACNSFMKYRYTQCYESHKSSK